MASFEKYQKLPTIVGAMQASAPGDFGVLGVLTTDDWIIRGADGTFVTMDDTTFKSKYTRASDTATLTGNDYN